MRQVFGVYSDFLGVLPSNARRFVALFSVLQAALALLDALALGLLALTIAPLSTGQPVVLPLIGELDDAGALVAVAAVCALIIAKGLLSVLLLRWATQRFARYELEIGTRLFRAFMAAPWLVRLRKNSSDIVRLADSSVNAAVMSFLLPGSTILGEIASLVAILLVLVIAQPAIALVTLLYLGAIGAVLYFWIARHARTAGRVNLQFTLQSGRFITEMVGAMKEITLRNKNGEVVDVVRRSREHSTRARANVYFLGQVPRFVLESAIVGGFVLVGAVGFTLGGAGDAITAVALFGLAGFRMAPSIIRLQSVLSQMISAVPHPVAVTDEIRTAEEASAGREAAEGAPFPTNPRKLELSEVVFKYSSDARPAVDSVSLTIPFGTTAAVVGQSGSGKSTLVDLILGLIDPTGGTITVDGASTASLTQSWRERVAYVPQEVALFDGTVAENVALSWSGEFDRDRVRAALRRAQLLDTVESREGGIDARVGERGLALSGGQRQRLGIARALYAEPLVLVLDEATSALDTKTEAAVMESIRDLRGDVTLVIVAHRLATVKDADQVFYLKDGRVAGSGRFSEVVATVPEFAQQAALAGLV
ncbi:ABC transporter ATP-binding protein [Ruicaihuangia caeni]|uniref:ABC transporter ATP-binding protein n=1 Tax=Ruicaihuangia caeni TaxID=3042517 RepID=A0AAW6TAH2_9MICO|nr:ABC transporter ATP-binding protein [Klugiella sp. YN-L-19]MDI2099409.1 ABC transporter ATP-binding protein [Klugiella sp. YN-L-19]